MNDTPVDFVYPQNEKAIIKHHGFIAVSPSTVGEFLYLALDFKHNFDIAQAFSAFHWFKAINNMGKRAI